MPRGDWLYVATRLADRFGSLSPLMRQQGLPRQQSGQAVPERRGTQVAPTRSGRRSVTDAAAYVQSGTVPTLAACSLKGVKQEALVVFGPSGLRPSSRHRDFKSKSADDADFVESIGLGVDSSRDVDVTWSSTCPVGCLERSLAEQECECLESSRLPAVVGPSQNGGLAERYFARVSKTSKSADPE